MLGNDLHFHAALFVGALDRLHDHFFGVGLGEDGHRLALLDQTQRRPSAGLAHRGARKGHNVSMFFDGRT